jgi:hypothetical protein
MGNGFRRIALAQGLLPPARTSEVSPAWTDAVLSALLQIDETTTPCASVAREMDVPDPALTARIPAAGFNGLMGRGQI